MFQRIVGFHQDEENHWVADLACGHARHMRHKPPMVERPWVLTAAGRNEFVGESVECKRCEDEVNQAL